MKKTLVALALSLSGTHQPVMPNFEAAAVSGSSRPAWGGTRRHSGVAKARREAKQRRRAK